MASRIGPSWKEDRGKDGSCCKEMSPTSPTNLDGSAHPLQQLGGPSLCAHVGCALLGVPELVQALGQGSGVAPSRGAVYVRRHGCTGAACASPR